MSFEAVPCMFTGRAEDGNESQLFGLLIRPSGSIGGKSCILSTESSLASQQSSTSAPLDSKLITASTSNVSTTLEQLKQNTSLILKTNAVTPSTTIPILARPAISPLTIASKSRSVNCASNNTINNRMILPAKLSGQNVILSSKKPRRLSKNNFSSNTSIIPISPKLASSGSQAALLTCPIVEQRQPILMAFCEPRPGCSKNQSTLPLQSWGVPSLTSDKNIISTANSSTLSNNFHSYAIPIQQDQGRLDMPINSTSSQIPQRLANEFKKVPSSSPLSKNSNVNVKRNYKKKIYSEQKLSSCKTAFSNADSVENIIENKDYVPSNLDDILFNTSKDIKKTTEKISKSSELITSDELLNDFSDMPILIPVNCENDGNEFAESSQQQKNLSSNNLNEKAKNMTPIFDKKSDDSPPPTPPIAKEPLLSTTKSTTVITLPLTSDIIDESAPPPNDPEPSRQPAFDNDEENDKKLFSFTTSVSLDELAERLYTNIDPEQLRQLTSLIHSRSIETPNLQSSRNQLSATADTKINKTAALIVDDILKQSTPKAAENFSTTVIIPSKLKECSISNVETTTILEDKHVENKLLKLQEVSNDTDNKTIEDSINCENYHHKIAYYRRNVRAKLNEQLCILIDSLEQNLRALDLQLSVKPQIHYQSKLWTQKGSIEWAELENRIAKRKLSPKSTCERLLTEKNYSKPQRRQKSTNNKTTDADVKQQSSVMRCVNSKEHYNFYTKIKTNVRLEPPPTNNSKRMFCKCDSKSPCISSKNCINRAEKVECASSHCTLIASECKNRQFGNHDRLAVDAKLRIFSTTLETNDTSDSGKMFGVRTTEPFAKNQLICEFLGELVSEEAHRKRFARYNGKEALSDCHAVPIQKGFVLDATRKGNVARFIGHSCKPNCELQTWTISGEKRVGVFATRNIFSGEVLTINYANDKILPFNLLTKALSEGYNCFCLSQKCPDTDKTPINLSTNVTGNNRRKKINANNVRVERKPKKLIDKINQKYINIEDHFNKTSSDLNSKGSIAKRFRRLDKPASDFKKLFLRRTLRVAKHIPASTLKRPFTRMFTANAKYSKSPNTKLIYAIQFIDKMFHDFIKFCTKNERIASKRLRYLFHQLRRYFIDELVHFNPESHNIFKSFLETFNIIISRWIDGIRPIYGVTCTNAIVSHYINAKETISIEYIKKHSTEITKEIEQSISIYGKRQKLISTNSKFIASKSPTPSKRNSTDTSPNSVIHQRALAIAQEADLSYMDSTHLVGSYNPDKEVQLTVVDEDSVRCICGIMEDEGVMTQCDSCKFWLHTDCLDVQINDNEEFICDFCKRSLKWTPNVDIVLYVQPKVRLSGCVYYRTLVNTHGMQIRINETVYVKRIINDEHKQVLRKLYDQSNSSNEIEFLLPTNKKVKESIKESILHETSFDKRRKRINPTSLNLPKDKKRKLSNLTTITTTDNKNYSSEKIHANKWHETTDYSGGVFERSELRTFRVERLFISPDGRRFVFGVYYARPHETFCDSSRTFYRNELFWTPLFDTLPLDAVVGRCLILEPNIWASGRPKSPKYLEEDVFICEYQIDRNQRSFEKIPLKNRYPINTEPYVFDHFKEKRILKREFTPFILHTHPTSSPHISPNKLNGNTESYSIKNSLDTLTIVMPSNNCTTPTSSSFLTIPSPRSTTLDSTALRELSIKRLERICRRITKRKN